MGLDISKFFIPFPLTKDMVLAALCPAPFF